MSQHIDPHFSTDCPACKTFDGEVPVFTHTARAKEPSFTITFRDNTYDYHPWQRAWQLPQEIPLAMGINLRGPREAKPWGFLNALSRAYRHVRRDVWHARESRLRATWESYG